MKRFYAAIIILVICLWASVKAQENAPQSNVLVVKSRINEWVDLFNKREIKKLKTLYAEDFLAVYLNQPDQNLDVTFQSFDHLFKNNFLEMKMSINALEIEAEGNMAYVRLNQISEVRPKNAKKSQYGQDTGMQIWKKNNDGLWQLSRSVMIPVQMQSKKKSGQ